MMSEHEDLLIQWKITNIFLARIYGALLSNNPNVQYVDQESLQTEIDVINEIIEGFCGDVLDER